MVKNIKIHEIVRRTILEFVKAVLITGSFLGILAFSVPMFLNIVNIGNISGLFVCITIPIIIKFYYHIINNKILFYMLISYLIIAAILAVTAAVLSVMMLTAISNEPSLEIEEATVIILGCKIIDEKPSLMLERRLEKAYDYLSANTSANCVVSGGMGSDEAISEALAMYTWLTEKGISESRIFMEDKSTNTDENIKFSSEKISEYNLSQNIIVVSDSFHLYRGQKIAGKIFDNVKCLGSDTRIYLLPTYWVREWFAIIGGALVRK